MNHWIGHYDPDMTQQSSFWKHKDSLLETFHTCPSEKDAYVDSAFEF
jgi:hypothetical protein